MMPLPSLVWCIIQVSLVAGIALLVCWFLRGTRPQFTTALLAGCSLASLLLGVLAWLPATQWSIRDSSFVSWMGPGMPAIDSSISSATIPVPLANTSTNSPAATSFVPAQETVTSDAETTASPLPAMFVRWFLAKVQSIDEGIRHTERLPTAARSQWGSRVAWALCIGIGLMTGLWIHGWLWMRWMVHDSERLFSQDIDIRLRRISQQMKLRRQPVLRVSDRIPIGATVGIRKPVLLLNRDWQGWTDQEIEAVLLHEIAHIARRDFLWVVVGSWVRVLFFFHPLMHLMMHRWRMEQELAADQLAAGWMKDARAYGRALASLALRAECSERTPSPMLSAEQICVIRRITMLKQGHLLPCRHGWRWGAAITSLTVVLCLPLTGLRGTPPDEKLADEKSPAAMSNDPAPADENLERFAERIQRLKEVNEKCPPLQFDGSMIWNPKRFLSADFDPGVRYLHNVLTFTLLGSYPEESSIHGRTHVVLNWSDIEKEHGELQVGAQVSEADQVNPKVLSRLLTHPSMGGLRQSNQVKLIEGRQATGITQRTFDSETRSWKESDAPVAWMVDDEQGFLHGSEDEIAARLQGKDDPFSSIPADFLELYKSAAFATVFADCTTWKKEVEQHFEGSKEEDKITLAFPLLNELQRLGVFLSGNGDYDCIVRAGYGTVETAKKSKRAIDGMVLLALVATASNPQDDDAKMVSELLGSLRVEQIDREVRLSFNPPISLYQSLASSEQQRCPVPGWFTLLGTVNAFESDPNTVRFQTTSVGCIPSFLTQTISAETLRGKRVRLTAELGCKPEELARAGLVLWSSKHDGQSTGQASIAVDSKSTIATIANHDPFESQGQVASETYPLALELDVAADSDVLSLGIYAKQIEVLVSKVTFEVIGPAQGATSAADPITPLNLLQVPFVAVQDEPRNLDFKEPLKTPTTEVLELAEKEAAGTSRK